LEICARWRLLTRDPSLWTELSFIGKKVATRQAGALLVASPLLKKVSLIDRSESDVVLKVCTSDLLIENFRDERGVEGRRRWK
jgi:hypothetical protein